MTKSDRIKVLGECFDLAHTLVLKYTSRAMDQRSLEVSRNYDAMADGAKAVEMAIGEKIRAITAQKV